MFSASVARRCQVVKKTCVGAVPRTAAATEPASSRSAVSGVIRSSTPSGRRHRPATSQPSARRRCARLPPLMPVTPTTSARLLIGSAVRRRSSSSPEDASTCGFAPRRPRTTQMARAVSVPSLLSRWGVDEGKVIESPGPRTNSSKPTTTRSDPLSTKPELVAAVAHERVGRAGRTAGLVGRLHELAILVGPEHQPLPAHAGVELDGRSVRPRAAPRARGPPRPARTPLRMVHPAPAGPGRRAPRPP